MSVVRLVLLLLVLGSLTIFALQNLSPSLPLVFLGMQTRAFPLALLVLVAIAAGALTTFVVSGLFQLSNYFSAKSLRSQLRELEQRQSRSTQQRYQSPPPSGGQTSYASASAGYGATTSRNDFEEGDDEGEQPLDRPDSFQGTTRDSSTYEVRQEPKTAYQSGSVYSYSYRDPKESGVGRTESVRNSEVDKPESVVDADYRVVNPPRQQPQEDDWGFFDDDESDDENSSRRSRRSSWD